MGNLNGGTNSGSDEHNCQYVALNMDRDIKDANNSSSVQTTKLNQPIDPEPKQRRQFFEALQRAISSGNLNECTELLKGNYDINSFDCKYYFHPLLLAAKKGYHEIMILLLNKGTDINFADKKKMTALHYAIEQKHELCSQLLIDHGINVNTTNYLENLPLHDAVAGDMFSIVQMLLKKKSDPMAPNHKRKLKTPLHIAAEKGHLRILNLLLESNASWNLLDKKKRLPLHWAALNNHSECCHALLTASSKDETTEQVNARDLYDQTPFILASEKGYDKCCKVLLDFNGDPTLSGKNFNTALHYASMGGYKSTIRKILKCSPKTLTKNRHGDTPIHLLIKCLPQPQERKKCEDRYLECLEILYTHFDQDPETNISNQNALHLVAKYNWVKGFNFLIKVLPDVNKSLCSVDNDGNTPLLIALKKDSIEIVQTIISENVDSLISCDLDGNSPLHLASSKGLFSISNILLKKSNWKNFHIPNLDRMTPLHLAAKDGSFDCCKLILRGYPSLSVVDCKGYTPLHYAVERGSLEITKLLTKRNRSSVFDIIDISGDTVLHLAARNGHYECCQHLLETINNNLICQKNLQGQTALDDAFHNEKDEIFNLILMKLPFQNENKICGKDNNSYIQSCLHKHFHTAVQKDRRKIQESIIKSDWWTAGISSDFCEEVQNQACQNLIDVTCINPIVAEIIYDKCTIQTGKRIDYDFWIFENSHYLPLSDDDRRDPFLKRKSPFEPVSGNFLIDDAIKFDSEYQHPIMAAVKKGHLRLMRHPLTEGYLNYRWNSNIWHYLLFLLFIEFLVLCILGSFIASIWNWDMIFRRFNVDAPNSFSISDTNSTIANDSIKSFVDKFCMGEIETDFIDDKWSQSGTLYFAMVSGIFILMIIEIFYFVNLRVAAYTLASSLRISRLIGISITIFPFSMYGCFSYSIAIITGWQWQLGIFTFLISWFHMMHILNKFPSLTAFMSVTPTFVCAFLRVILYIGLMIISFAFSFHLLLSSNPAFDNIGVAYVKTIVWLLGDLGYDDTFLSDDGSIPYPGQTNIIFLFLVTTVTGFIVHLFISQPMDLLTDIREKSSLYTLVRRIRLTMELDKLFQESKFKHLNRFWRNDNVFLYEKFENMIQKLFCHTVNIDHETTNDPNRICEDSASLVSILKTLEEVKKQNELLNQKLETICSKIK